MEEVLTLNREIVEISVEDIIPNRFQPRLTFDMEALSELANSIREHGIIQPLVVRKIQDKYEIIAGERRYKAASLIGMKKVPCIIMNLNDNESAEVAVIENIQRKEMTPLEEAKSFKKLLDKGYLTQEELAKRMGKSQSSIANKLRLLNLDEVVQEAILNGKISERHARSLLKVSSKEEQRNILKEIIEKRLTVKQTDDLIKERENKVSNMNDGAFNNFNSNMNNIFNNSNTNMINENNLANRNNSFSENNNTHLSTPEINIPISNNENPQMNLINSIGSPNQTQGIIKDSNNYGSFNRQSQQNNNDSIFKFTDINTNTNFNLPQDNNQNNNETIDYNSILNPSVFSNQVETTVENTNKLENNDNFDLNSLFTDMSNSLNVDINNIKNTAEDILPKEEAPKDISQFMVSEKPENKFFVDLDIPTTFNQEELPFKVKNAVEAINRKIEELKMQGVNINKEEKNSSNTYEIIIRIDK